MQKRKSWPYQDFIPHVICFGLFLSSIYKKISVHEMKYQSNSKKINENKIGIKPPIYHIVM